MVISHSYVSLPEGNIRSILESNIESENGGPRPGPDQSWDDGEHGELPQTWIQKRFGIVCIHDYTCMIIYIVIDLYWQETYIYIYQVEDCMCICIMHDYMYLIWLMYIDWQEAYTCINYIYIYIHRYVLVIHWDCLCGLNGKTERLICLDICNSSDSVSLLRLMRTINLFLLVNHQAVTLETQRVTDWSDCKCYPLVMTNVAIENGPLIVDVPIINCDCP